jgi:hypothetical protein
MVSRGAGAILDAGGDAMSLTRRDAASAVLAALVALVYLSNTHDWGVPLLQSNRWAAGAILVLGLGTCTLGRAGEDFAQPIVIALSLLGTAALVLAIAALATGAQWAIALLALDTLVLWIGSTLRHATTPIHRPLHPA